MNEKAKTRKAKKKGFYALLNLIYRMAKKNIVKVNSAEEYYVDLH